MSGTTIEKSIVQMEFDAKKFRDGVSDSTAELSKFKQQFDFKSAEDAFQNIEKVANIDFTGMSNALEGINSKLSIMGVAAGVIVAKITEAAISGAKKLADTLVLGAVTDGFGEYETQLNAVQTILANTSKAGVNLQDVTGALDELNEYADLTIYNFTEMTKNIGTFTAAGVDLDTSVQAIKGIANLAAVSGSSSVQAATAMYQLSQALSTGTVKLMDWNSVQTAGLGGQVFQEALITTAKVHGQSVENMIKQDGDFRSTLQRGWLSSEILLETLSQFTGDLTDAQLESMGYTAEQIVEIQKLAVVANDAATKVKTFTALKDTLGEALGSGWATSFRLIIGDFEQAKELWGGVAASIGTVIDASSDARNEMLGIWERLGGRQKLVDAFMNILDGLLALLDRVSWAFKQVFGQMDYKDLFKITYLFQQIGWFLEDAGDHSRRFGNAMRGIFAAISIVFMVIKAILKPIFALISTLSGGSGSVLDFASDLGTAVYQFQQFAEKTDFFDKVVADVIARVGEFIAKVKVLVDKLLELKVVAKVVEWLKQLDKSDWLNVLKVAETVLTALIAPFYLLGLGAQLLYKEIVKLKVVKDVVAWFNNIDWEATAQYFKDLAGEAQELFDTFKTETIPKFIGEIDEMILSIQELWEEFRSSDVIESFLELVGTFDGRRIKQFGTDAKEGFSWIDTIKESDFGKWVNKTLGDAGAKAKEFGGELLESLTEAFNYFTENADNLDYSHLFDIINTGLFAGFVLSIRKIASGDFIGGALDDSDFGEGIIDVFGKLEGTIGSFQNNIRADTLQKIAISIALLAGAVLLLTLVDSTKLDQATKSIGAMLLALFGSSVGLKLVKPAEAIKSAVVIIGLAIAVAIMAAALKIMSGIDPEEMETGMEGMIGALVALVTAVGGLKLAKGGSLKSVVVITGISLALIALAGAIVLFGNLDPDVLAQGLIGVGLALGGLTASLAILSKTGGDKNSSLKASIAMLAIAKAMEKLWESVVKFGMLKLEVLGQGLGAIGLIMAGMALFSKVIKTKKILEAGLAMIAMAAALLIVFIAVESFGKMDFMQLVVGMTAIIAIIALFAIASFLMSGAMPAATAMVVMAAAMILLAIALKILGSIEVEDLMAGIIAIAAILGIFIIAGYLLIPVVPVLIGFGIALMLMGIGAALFGVGIFLAATGLAALAGAFVLIGSSLAVIGPALVEWIPKLAVAVANGIADFITTIAERIPEIVEAGKTILLAIIEGVTTIIPEIAILVGEMIVALLEALALLLPDIIQAGYDILLAFIQGAADNIKEIVAAGLELITEFMAGIESGIPDLVLQVYSMILTFLESIDAAVVLYQQDIIDAGFSIAIHLITGLTSGLEKNLPLLKEAVLNLVREVIKQMGLGFLLGSPSRVTYDIAVQVIQGFVNGVKSGLVRTRDVMAEFAEVAKNGMRPLLDNLGSEIDQRLELKPLISPVMDISNITAGAGLIQSAFGGVSIPLDLTTIGVRANSSDNDVTYNDRNGTDGITYNQYNYSPKALDREAIYRQTRTQVATLSRRAFER